MLEKNMYDGDNSVMEPIRDPMHIYKFLTSIIEISTFLIHGSPQRMARSSLSRAVDPNPKAMSQSALQGPPTRQNI